MKSKVLELKFLYFSVICCLLAFLSVSCIFFQTTAERIQYRKVFTATCIPHSSMKELRLSYQQHFKMVSEELKQLESFYNETQDKPLWLQEKIGYHRKYLKDMEQYLFLCPEHVTKVSYENSKRCSHCKGKGYFLPGAKCTTCSGTGKVTHKIVKCQQCNQYYRGNILGRTLNENK